MQIRGKWIEIDAIDGTKIRLSNNEYLRARNAGNTADIQLFKLNTANVLEFAAAPLLKLGMVIEDPGAGANTITINAPTGLTASYALVLPGDDGTPGQFLQTDGSGNLSWATGGGSGEVNTASNVGTGNGVFKQKTGVDLEFKSLIAGTNVTITNNANDLTIDVASSGEANTASNLGTGAQSFKAKVGVDLQFRSIVQGSNITITQNANDITIDGPAPGETNTASSIGAGSAVFKQKTGVNLEFRSLVQGSNITITQNANDITISAPAPGETNTVSNVGGGSGVFKQKTGVDFELKTLIGTQGISITNNANDLTFSLPGTTKGDILVHNGTTLVRLGVGTNGQVLEADSATATGVKWATPSGGGGGANTSLSNLIATSINQSLIFSQSSTVYAPYGGFNADVGRVWAINQAQPSNADFIVSSAGLFWDGAFSGATATAGQFQAYAGKVQIEGTPSGYTGNVTAGQMTLDAGSVNIANTNTKTYGDIFPAGLNITCGQFANTASGVNTFGAVNQGVFNIVTGDLYLGGGATFTGAINDGANATIGTGSISGDGTGTVSLDTYTKGLSLFTGGISSILGGSGQNHQTGAIGITTGSNSHTVGGIFSGGITLTTGAANAGTSGDITLQVGSALIPEQQGKIRLNANEIIPETSLAFWTVRKVLNTDFTAAATSEEIGWFSLPPRASVEFVMIRNSVAFTKAGLTALTLEVGISGDSDRFATAYDCFSAPGDATQQTSNNNGVILDYNNAVAVTITGRSTGTNIDAMTAGAAIVAIKYAVLPYITP